MTQRFVNVVPFWLSVTLHWEKKRKMALLESNFENRLSFVEESRFFFFIYIVMFGGKKALPPKAKSDLFWLWNGSPIKVGTKMELHREPSYGQPNGSPRRAILALFFSQCVPIPHNQEPLSASFMVISILLLSAHLLIWQNNSCILQGTWCTCNCCRWNQNV